jgi:hypothetical protein
VFPFVVVLVVGFICGLPGFLLARWSGDIRWLVGVVPGVCVIIPLGKLFENKSERLRAAEVEALSDTACCAECGGVFNVQDMIAHSGLYVCARCKPIFLQKLVEGAKISDEPENRRAFRTWGFWIWVLVPGILLAVIIFRWLTHLPWY